MANPLPFKPPLSKNQLAAIGRATALWAMLEVNMDRHLRILSQYANKEGHNVDDYLAIPFKKRIKLWRKLAKLAYESINEPDELSGLMKIIDRAAELRPERDKIIHGHWYSIGHFGSRHLELEAWRQTDKETRTPEIVTVDYINDVAWKISWLISDYLDLLDPNYENHPRPSIQRPKSL